MIISMSLDGKPTLACCKSITPNMIWRSVLNTEKQWIIPIPKLLLFPWLKQVMRTIKDQTKSGRCLHNQAPTKIHNQELNHSSKKQMPSERRSPMSNNGSRITKLLTKYQMRKFQKRTISETSTITTSLVNFEIKLHAAPASHKASSNKWRLA